MWRGHATNNNSKQVTLSTRPEGRLGPQFELAMSTPVALELVCIIYPCDKPSKLGFSITLGNDKSVDHLKDAIKCKNANSLKDIDAKELTLYKVSIPRKSIAHTLSTLQFDGSDDRVEELDFLDSLFEVFPNGVEKKHFHIVAIKTGCVSHTSLLF